MGFFWPVHGEVDAVGDRRAVHLPPLLARGQTGRRRHTEGDRHALTGLLLQ